MQYSVPTRPDPNYDRSKWTRKRQNWKLFRKVGEPLQALYGTQFDPWSYDPVNEEFKYDTNPVWEAAMAEYNRRYDLYMQKRPF